MVAYTTRTARKDDGSPYMCFRTLEVLSKDTPVGMIQCVGPCYGITADPGHKHHLWIAFTGVGALSRNLPGRYGDIEAAACAVLAAAGA